MSLFESKTVTLPDGAELLLRSPEVDEAPRLIEYLDAVRRESGFLMWGPEDDLPDEESERKWVQSRRDEEGGEQSDEGDREHRQGGRGVDEHEDERDHEGQHQRADHGELVVLELLTSRKDVLTGIVVFR